MKFREMRRKKQQLSVEECIEILNKNTAGVLSVIGDHGYPYTVPLSYVYFDNTIYFHCAKEGHKIDAIKKDNKASFCVIEQDQIIPEKFTTAYKSVVLFGRAKILENPKEIRSAINKLAIKYSPDESEESRNNEIEGSINRLNMVKIEIEYMTGKQAIELVKKPSVG